MEHQDSFSSEFKGGKSFVNSIEKTTEMLNSFIKDADAYKMSEQKASVNFSNIIAQMNESAISG